tara:strand:- start:575 stop:2386 length:1812 start_codon:yes stop_codon:yes gene_type:complete
MFAVPFALYGRKPPSAALEDDWINDDASEGSVVLVLDDGTTITRSRKRGKATRLNVVAANGAKLAGNIAAQDFIVELLGLSEQDFFATCFFEQKQMSKIITAKPADRMKTVSAWLNLDPLVRCEENVRKRLAVVVAEYAVHERRRGALTEMILLKEKSMSGESLEALKAACDASATIAETARDELKQLQRDAAVLEAMAAKAAEYDDIVVQGKAQKTKLAEGKASTELQAAVDEARTVEADAAAERAAAHEQVVEKKQLAAGAFDGQCPVTCEECPVADAVTDQVTGNRTLVATVHQEFQAADERYRGATVQRQQVEREQERAIHGEAKLVSLRDRARALKPQRDKHLVMEAEGELPDIAAEEHRVDELWAASNADAVEYHELEIGLNDIKVWRQELDEIAVHSKGLDEDLATLREALVVFGRNGAQRATAEQALLEIETDANALLIESAIDLSIAVRWAHEAASGLAKHCEMCGAPFPTSQRVKECGQCRAKRGPKTINKLDITLSDCSGAAEDLAGIAFQLAAAAWLRRERNTSWSAAFIDEPFGSLDSANRRSLATKFATMLRGRFGFEQSMVVAHDQSIMDSLPGKIAIIAGDEGSTFE